MPLTALTSSGILPSVSALPDGYELVRPLGAGGFGEVVLARHVALDRLVAIKRIHAHALAGPADLERFRREARVLAGLDHPSIVRVYDFRRDVGDAQLVMEYVDGNPLDALVELGPLPAPRALRVLDDVATALAEAARHGIAHRDVKPGNVFVLRDGHAKLGDFGLARIAADPSVFRTSDGTSVGTPAYLPPEVGQGTGEPDAYSDAYSFAVMAYEVLTGHLPFEGMGAIAMIAAHMSQDPPAPADIVPGFPVAASDALLGGLAKDPHSRPLPHELVRRLLAVPEQAWPLVRPAPQRRGAPTVIVADSRPAPAPTAAPPVRRSVPWRWVAAAVAAVGVAVASVLLLTGRPPARGLEVSGIVVSATPTKGRCPEGTYRLVATLTTNGRAGTVRLRWVRPGGTALPTSEVQVPAGARAATAVLALHITGQRPVEGPAFVELLAPGAGRREASPPLSYTC